MVWVCWSVPREIIMQLWVTDNISESHEQCMHMMYGNVKDGAEYFGFGHRVNLS